MGLKTAMVETEAIIPTPSGEMPAFLYRPAAPAASVSSPAVLLLMEPLG
nr:hypothetical protein [Thermoleptolyngbya oregonensis]